MLLPLQTTATVLCRLRSFSAPSSGGLRQQAPAIPEQLQQPRVVAGSPELQAQLRAHEVSAMHTALEQETLGRETALLSRLLHKSVNQHRRTMSFMRLLEVCSCKRARKHSACYLRVAGIIRLGWCHLL